jgi:hypothetical protein
VAIAPRNTVAYYDSVVKTVGAAQARSSVRLFMVPGMGHGHALGDGPSVFDPVAVLEEWVEHGRRIGSLPRAWQAAARTARVRCAPTRKLPCPKTPGARTPLKTLLCLPGAVEEAARRVE